MQECSVCHYHVDGQFCMECYRYPKPRITFGCYRCNEFKPQHDCKKFERLVMERGESVYECVICKQVRIEVRESI